MIFEFRGPAKLARNPKQESFITLEARDEKEAQFKLRRYIRIGVLMRWYVLDK